MSMKREEHYYSVYRANFRACGGGGGGAGFFFFFFLSFFFQHVKKLLNFLQFCKDQGGKI